MGSMADMNLAATRQENVALRKECQRLAGIIEAMRAQDRLTALRAQFVAAELADQRIGCEESAIDGGFRAADLFVARLKAEAEAAMAEEAKDEGTGDSGADPGVDRPILVASEVGKDG